MLDLHVCMLATRLVCFLYGTRFVVFAAFPNIFAETVAPTQLLMIASHPFLVERFLLPALGIAIVALHVTHKHNVVWLERRRRILPSHRPLAPIDVDGFEHRKELFAYSHGFVYEARNRHGVTVCEYLHRSIGREYLPQETPTLANDVTLQSRHDV